MKINATNTAIILCYLAILLVSVAIKNSSIKSILLLIIIFYIALISVKKPSIGAIVLAGSLPISGIIRWSDLENIIASGYLTILIFLLSAVVFFRMLFDKKKNLYFSLNSNWLILSPFLLFLLVHIFLASSSGPVLFAMMRNYIIPFLAFFIFIEAVKSSENVKRKLIISLYISTVVVGVFNLIHYFYGLDIALSRFVMVKEDIPATRDYGLGAFPRMNHILGLGTQGSGGVFYAILALIGIYLTVNSRLKVKVLLIASALVFLVNIYFIGSISGVLTLFIGFVILGLTKNIKLIPILSFPFVIFILTGLFFFPIPITDFPNMASYAYHGFIAEVVIEASDYSLIQLLLGNELGLAGGGVDLIRTTGFLDRWLFGAFLQLGLVAFASMIMWYLFVFLIAFKNLRISKQKDYALLTLIILTGSLTYAHQSALMQPLFIYLIMLSLSLIYCKKPLLRGDEISQKVFLFKVKNST